MLIFIFFHQINVEDICLYFLVIAGVNNAANHMSVDSDNQALGSVLVERLKLLETCAELIRSILNEELVSDSLLQQIEQQCGMNDVIE